MPRKLPLELGHAKDRNRPGADVSDVIGERLKSVAKRTFGLGRYTVEVLAKLCIEASFC